MGYPSTGCFFRTSWYPLVNVYITMERSTMLFMGKVTISMAIFHSKLLNYQRVNHHFTLWQTNITMENHHFSWEKSLFQWPFSIANCWHNQRANHTNITSCRNASSSTPRQPRCGRSARRRAAPSRGARSLRPSGCRGPGPGRRRSTEDLPIPNGMVL